MSDFSERARRSQASTKNMLDTGGPMTFPITLRWVRGSGPVSGLIVAQAKTTMPLIPSHVEAVTPDGFWLGAHFDGGTRKRDADYDKATRIEQLILPLDSTDEQSRAFYAFLDKHVGDPYDWNAIIGLIPGFNWHEHDFGHSICSAMITLALRASLWLPAPLATPAHLVTPANLLLIVSGKMRVPMEKSGDGWV
jgi:hypothetical protein